MTDDRLSSIDIHKYVSENSFNIILPSFANNTFEPRAGGTNAGAAVYRTRLVSLLE